MIPQEFLEKYKLTEKVHNRYIFTQVNKGMYGLPQSGRVVHEALVKHMEPYGYHTSRKKLGLWKHNSQPINSTLVVDDFIVKYSVKEDALHLKSALEDKYKVTTDWEETL